MQKYDLVNGFVSSIELTAHLTEAYVSYLYNREIEKMLPARLFYEHDFCGVEFDAVTFIRRLI